MPWHWGFVYDGRQNIGQIDHTQFIFQPAHGAVQQADLPICARLLPDIKHISCRKSAQYRTGPIRSLVQQRSQPPPAKPVEPSNGSSKFWGTRIPSRRTALSSSACIPHRSGFRDRITDFLLLPADSPLFHCGVLAARQKPCACHGRKAQKITSCCFHVFSVPSSCCSCAGVSGAVGAFNAVSCSAADPSGDCVGCCAAGAVCPASVVSVCVGCASSSSSSGGSPLGILCKIVLRCPIPNRLNTAVAVQGCCYAPSPECARLTDAVDK